MEAKVIPELDRPQYNYKMQYSNEVLVGEWLDERLKFERVYPPTNVSEHRSEFKHYADHETERTMRRKNRIKHRGIDREFLFRHHGKAYDNNFVTEYDQDFHQIPLIADELPPKVFSPQIQKLIKPTSHGFQKNFQMKFQSDKGVHFTSETTDSFKEPPKSALETKRFSNPRHLSTSLFPPNFVNAGKVVAGSTLWMTPEYIDLPQLRQFQQKIENANLTTMQPLYNKLRRNDFPKNFSQFVKD